MSWGGILRKKVSLPALDKSTELWYNRNIETRYQDAFTASLRQADAEKEPHELQGYWFPSNLGGCDRASLLAHIGAEEVPPDDESLRNFWMGNRIHEELQARFPFEILGSERTARIRDDEYRVSGKLDLLARVDGVVEATEFKSVKAAKFEYDFPDETHILQLACYLTFPVICLHGSEYDPVQDYCDHEDKSTPLILPKPEQGRLVYWSKENAEIREVVVKPTPGLALTVMREFVRLEAIYQQFLKDRILPEAIPADNWRISKRNKQKKVYCNYAGTGKCCSETRRGDTVRVEAHNTSDNGELRLL